MNVEVASVVEQKDEECSVEPHAECGYVELGRVTEQTKGGFVGGSPDGGIGKYWP